MKSYYEWGKRSLTRLVRGPNGELRESLQGMAERESETKGKVKKIRKGKNYTRIVRCLLRGQKSMTIGFGFNILKLPIIGPILKRLLGGGIK